MQAGFECVPPSVVTSAETGVGKTPLLHLIAGLRVAYLEAKKQGRAAPAPPAAASSPA